MRKGKGKEQEGIRRDSMVLGFGVGFWCWVLVLGFGVGFWCWVLVSVLG